jgi:membrane protein DedA with SNARE-associated domain
MTAFVQAYAEWVVPVALALAFFKSLAFVSLVVPSSLVVALIVALVKLGHVPVWPVWLAVAVGAALGDWVSYVLGWRLKDRARGMWPFTRHPDLMPRGERFFCRWGAMSVVLCRFFSPLRATIPLLCGMFEMPAPVFQVANWTSAFLWSAVVLLIGEGVLHIFG